MTHNNKPSKGYQTNLHLFYHKPNGKKEDILHCQGISSNGNGIFLAQLYLKHNKNSKNEHF